MQYSRRTFNFSKLILLLILASGWFLSSGNFSQVHAAWYNSSWGYRKQITIDADQVSGTSNLTNFPVLINLSSDASLSANAQVDGDDILFTASDETTKLAHEIETYTTGTGALVAWVNIPTLDYDDDTTIYMYYGNSGASNQEDITNVWNGDYEAVLHLAEDPAGSPPQMLDSTSNNIDGTSGGTMTSGDQVTAKANGGLDFDNSDDHIDLGDVDIIDNNSTNSFTISAWVNRRSFESNDIIIAKHNDLSAPSGLGYTLYINAGDAVLFSMGTGGVQVCLTSSGPGTITTTGWNHVVAILDNQNNTCYVYVNGNATSSGQSAGDPTPSTLNLRIGTESDGGNPFDGQIDEVRFSSIPRSAGWIVTEYNNQNSPNTFYSLGSVESGLTLSQSAYRWFSNDNSTDVGSALAATNAPFALLTSGNQFRLRMLMHIEGSQLGIGDQTFKLQYATKAGTCDTSFAGETYADVTTITPIAFYNNASPADGVNVTTNVNDPTHNGHTNVGQTYEEANNFTTTSAIDAGEDGLWDFALYDYAAIGSESYCFRIVKSNGDPLDSYAAIPEIGIPVSLSFTIEGVGAFTTNNGITTSVTSTSATLAFGGIQVYTPKYAAHALTVTTNASSGYTVAMNLSTSTPNLQGLYPANIIDPFSATSVSWSNPIPWTSPDGVIPNVNTGWFGANTTDTRVSGWSDGELKFGPVSTNPNIVMQSSGPDNSTIYVTYGMEVNINQPTDLYSGLIIYTITPTY